MLYILDNPGVREAYFPSGAHEYAVEPARREDGAAIQAIIERHEGPESAKALKTWWSHAPETFYTAHNSEGQVAGFMSLFDPTPINPAFLLEDPILRGFCDHLRRNPLPAKNQRVLFSRGWRGLEQGEMISPVIGSIFLDCKRMYMSMRPNLRRVYLTLRDKPTFGPLFEGLGFKFTAEIKLGDIINHMGVLDMGPGSTDGWLAGLVAAELGVEEGGILDIDARELVLDGQRVALTTLEFGVINYLHQHEGKAVSRASLIENVWDHSYDGGSNVIDTVVLSIRKKLGERASVIETVRGVGYRFRGE
jgi:hypothetical protein